MVYNFNLGIGWASSGVEYAQAYRATMLRNLGIEAKYVYTDMFPKDNIQAMTENLGFLNEEIIWLYTYFTDIKMASVSYTLDDLEKTFEGQTYSIEKADGKIYYRFENNIYYTVYLDRNKNDIVHRVEMVSNGCLVRKDYFTYCRVFSEYYAPLDQKAHLYQRRFFNEDGTVAYDEFIDEDNIMYRFANKILYSKEELVAYMVQSLNLTESDVVILDRATMLGQPVMQNAKSAQIGVVVHADHFSEGSTDEDNILWNNFYEYDFAQYRNVSFYITATDAQNKLIREQFKKYVGVEPNVVTIPVGSLSELKYPEGTRKKNSLITASRLAKEKHVDWLIRAVSKVHETVEDVSLDIYGYGGEDKNLSELIKCLGCESYVRLCGQQNLVEVYKNYEAYFSASTSEGFGLSLMEAIGSGLPIVGFDVRYGNQAFIIDGQNGYKIPVTEDMSETERVNALADTMTNMLANDDMKAFHDCSYEVAKTYLTGEVEKRWQTLLT